MLFLIPLAAPLIVPVFVIVALVLVSANPWFIASTIPEFEKTKVFADESIPLYPEVIDPAVEFVAVTEVEFNKIAAALVVLVDIVPELVNV